MHSDVLDDKGRKRFGVFYKAAFYDRSCMLSFVSRYEVFRQYIGDHETGTVASKVIDNATGEVIFDGGHDPQAWSDGDRDHAAERCHAFLNANYPDHADPFKYEWL
jgi:hypothetical protein